MLIYEYVSIPYLCNKVSYTSTSQAQVESKSDFFRAPAFLGPPARVSTIMEEGPNDLLNDDDGYDESPSAYQTGIILLPPKVLRLFLICPLFL